MRVIKIDQTDESLEGLAIEHGGARVLSLFMRDAKELHKLLGEHFGDDKDRRIADLDSLRANLSLDNNARKVLDVHRVNAIKQLNAVIDGLRAELAALKAQTQPCAEPPMWTWLNERGIEWHTTSEQVAQKQWEAGHKVYGPKSAHFPSRPRSAISAEFVPYIGPAKQPLPPSQQTEPPSCITKDSPNDSPMHYENKAANKSPSSHANALRGPLERDTIAAGVKPADSALSGAWKDGWKV